MKTKLNWDPKCVVIVISLTTLLLIGFLLIIDCLDWKNNFVLGFTVISLVCTLILSVVTLYDEKTQKV